MKNSNQLFNQCLQLAGGIVARYRAEAPPCFDVFNESPEGTDESTGATGDSPTPDAKSTADSSPALEDAKPPESLQDVVKDIIDSHKEESASSTEQEEEQPSEEEGTEKEEPGATSEDAPSEEEAGDTTLEFHKHPRFQELLKQSKELRTEVEQLKPKAQVGETLIRFCQENQIDEDDLRIALDMAAVAKKSPKEFRDRLKAYLDNVEIHLGDKFPADIQKKLDEGIIDLDTAKELAQARLKAQGLDRQLQESQAQAQQRAQQEMGNALNMWQTSKMRLDPDFEKKYPLLEKVYLAMAQEKPPKGAKEAVALAEQAYLEVNKSLTPFSSRSAPRKQLKTVNGSSAKTTQKITKLDSLDRESLMAVARQVIAEHS